MNEVIRLRSRLVVALYARQEGTSHEAGQATTEYLGLAALGIAAIVVIGAAVKVLGVDVVNWIRAQLGV